MKIKCGKCYYTGFDISFELIAESKNRPHNFTPSLDRKIPELGYTKGNVVWTAYCINRMKNDLSDSKFIDMCKLISSRMEN